MPKNWVEKNEDSSGAYNTNSQVKLKYSMLKSSLCDYSDAYILVNGKISVTVLATGRGNNNKEVIFKNCASFTDWTRETNNTQIDHAKDIVVVMPVYSLIKYSDNFSKMLGRLWQYYRPSFS